MSYQNKCAENWNLGGYVFQWSFDLAQNRMKNYVLKILIFVIQFYSTQVHPAIIQQSLLILKTAENQQWENENNIQRPKINKWQ